MVYLGIGLLADVTVAWVVFAIISERDRPNDEGDDQFWDC